MIGSCPPISRVLPVLAVPRGECASAIIADSGHFRSQDARCMPHALSSAAEEVRAAGGGGGGGRSCREIAIIQSARARASSPNPEPRVLSPKFECQCQAELIKNALRSSAPPAAAATELRSTTNSNRGNKPEGARPRAGLGPGGGPRAERHQ